MPLNNTFDPVPDDKLALMGDYIRALLDTIQEYPGILHQFTMDVLIDLEINIYNAEIDRGMIEVFNDPADIPVIESPERITDTIPVVPPDLEPEWSPDDTQQATAFDAFIEDSLFDEEDYL